jgi:starch synthase (maltosyl-transferring)
MENLKMILNRLESGGHSLPGTYFISEITGIIPYYQEYYGIDGARIDMGHVLPPALNQTIVARVKSNNRHFILWSEEFAPEHSQTVKENGFDFISGNLWSVYNDIDKPSFAQKMF